jgi:hypothetical protein
MAGDDPLALRYLRRFWGIRWRGLVNGSLMQPGVLPVSAALQPGREMALSRWRRHEYRHIGVMA